MLTDWAKSGKYWYISRAYGAAFGPRHIVGGYPGRGAPRECGNGRRHGGAAREGCTSTRAKSAKRCDVDQCVSSVQDRPRFLIIIMI